MTPTDYFADSILRMLDFLKTSVADLSDAELMIRPVPGANHGIWQLGHLAVSDHRLVSMAKPGVMPELPAGFAERFSKETCKNDDPNAFGKKEDILEVLTKQRTAGANWVKTLSAKDLEQPITGPMVARLPTVGHVVNLLPTHVAMHLGQIQVLRRKLGKPILF